ncbi:MAG: glucose 1-dehydrogenase [Actinomycetota bacterium]|nr:glucose 1-dehydrogenase [Actinomycetota bacterium]
MDDMLAPFRLDGRTAIITGASSGLGTRFAEVLAGAGAEVVLAARRVDRLEELAGRLPGATAVACDVSKQGDLQRLVDTTLARTGRIDVLVNNAGVSDPGPAELEDIDQFRQVIDINLTAVFALSQLVARHMLERGSGSIIQVASVLGLVGCGQIPQAGYAASKGGVVILAKELAAQWARRGIRVNALCPGWFPSEMTADMFSDEGTARWVRRKTPMGRGGDNHELDGALLFLASDASSYVTGVALPVDGGFSAI